MRLGLPREYLVDGIEPGVRNAFESAASELEALGAHVEETSLPLTDYALAVYYIIAPSEASANLARYDGFKYGYSESDASNSREVMDRTRGRGFGAEVKRRILLGAYALSAGYYDAYYKKAQQVRTLILREFREAFNKFDALLTPTSPTVAFPMGSRVDDPLSMYLSDVCTVPANIAGLPGISVPAGFSGNMPVGLQVLGPQFGDATILRIAYAYEQATNWRFSHPDDVEADLEIFLGDPDQSSVKADQAFKFTSDNTVIHADADASIGDDVTIGHGVVCHSRYIGNGALIGNGAVLNDGVEVGEGSLVAAGAVLPERVVIPAGSLVRGMPGRVLGRVRDRHRELMRGAAKSYVDRIGRYKEAGLQG
ncbi:Glutamyl-tRNA(Gln) amidotransferase subunit A [Geodia barretti]|uniref:Glutamyl-tRNA(Gln) amidotransferase subunit A n=1 Tax=Geodia barretti TaxID=519541 RepID=A0AA35RCM7_GEOBA|nr:Glutamyl-tRNA(Gln) amidotransferase subunit A [Geodia barretti]